MAYTIGDVKKIIKELDDQTKLNAYDLPITVNTRKYKVLGTYTNGKGFEFSKVFLDNATSYDLEQVVKHEYAHHMVFIHYGRNVKSHGKEFKYCCSLINCTLDGATVELQCKMPEQRKKQARNHALTCDKCATTFKYARKSQAVKIAIGEIVGKLTCPNCGNHNFNYKKMM